MPANRTAPPVVAATLSLTLALGGCVPLAGDPVAASSSPDALSQVIGVDDPALADLLREESSFNADLEELTETASSTLAFAIDTARSTVPDAAGMSGSPQVVRASFSEVPSIPGVHTPVVVFDQPRDDRGTVGGNDVHVTGRTSLEVASQSAAYRATVTKDARAGDRQVLKDERTVDVDVPVCVPDAGAGWEGTVSHRRVVEVPDGDSTVRVEVTTDATAHRGANDKAMRLDAVQVTATRTVTRADGSTTSESGTMSGTVPAVTLQSSAGGETTAGLRVTDAGDWFSAESGNLFLSSIVSLVPEMQAAFSVATEAQTESGLCVMVVADARGVTTLSPGESTPVDATIVDSRTGESIPGLPVEAWSATGSANPAQFAAAGTTSFTAGNRDSPYQLYVSTKSPRGGDSAEVIFSGGWAFEGVVLTITVDDVSASQTWSGYVCGNPLTEAWHFIQFVDGIGEIPIYRVPYPLGVRPGEWGQVPMIEPVPDAGEDEPPFRLYIDDVEPPEVLPREQRIEVPVHPVEAGQCK